MKLIYKAAPARGARDIYLCRSLFAKTPLVLKVYSRTERAAYLHEVLSQAANRTDLICRPYFLDELSGTVGMEYCGEQSVLDVFHQGDRQRAVFDAGHWLRNYHRDTTQNIEASGRYRGSDPLDDIVRQAPPDMIEKARPLLDHFRSRARDHARQPTRIVLTFADIKPDNLIYASRGLVGIDRKPRGKGRAETDVACFLVALKRLYEDNPRLEDRDWQNAERIFLDAYQYPEDTRALLKLAQDRARLRLWFSANARMEHGEETQRVSDEQLQILRSDLARANPDHPL